jgi:hypothetical protein
MILSLADRVMQYGDALLLYSGIPVYVREVGQNAMTLRTIQTGKVDIVPVVLEDFSPITRMGFVNIYNSVVEVVRQPARKYSIGMTRDNTAIRPLPVRYPRGEDCTLDKLGRLTAVELFDTINGIYPPIEEALDTAQSKEGACAFDRQFAVSKDLEVLYKTRKVGYVDKKASSVKEIVFHKQYSYLTTLLKEMK